MHQAEAFAEESETLLLRLSWKVLTRYGTGLSDQGSCVCADVCVYVCCLHAAATHICRDL